MYSSARGSSAHAIRGSTAHVIPYQGTIRAPSKGNDQHWREIDQHSEAPLGDSTYHLPSTLGGWGGAREEKGGIY